MFSYINIKKQKRIRGETSWDLLWFFYKQENVMMALVKAPECKTLTDNLVDTWGNFYHSELPKQTFKFRPSKEIYTKCKKENPWKG